MSDSETAQRHLAAETGVDPERLHLGNIKAPDWPALLKAASDSAGVPFHLLDDGDLSIFGLRAQARQIAVRQGDLRLIVVDYLQLMRAERPSGNRVEDVSEFSRGLKRLARELKCPVLAVAQLSRAVEQRPDKRPVLSDLRECVAGDTRVALADGRHVEIAKLVGTTPDVVAVDPIGRLTTARARQIWEVGVRELVCLQMASGRSIRLTSEHRLLGATGWTRLRDVRPGDRLALARKLSEPGDAADVPDEHLVLLGHLIGDGSYSSREPIRYTTVSAANLRAVVDAARRIGCRPRVTDRSGRTGWEVSLGANANRWHPGPLRALLAECEMLGETAATKHVPEVVFRASDSQVALFLRHLWATDGCVWTGRRPDGRLIPAVYYATISPRLAEDVALLLLRVGIVARIKVRANRGTYAPNYHVIVSDRPAQRRFLELVGSIDPEHSHATRLLQLLTAHATSFNTNADTVPMEVWEIVRRRMLERGITQRQMCALRGTSYGGTSHFRFAPSRTTLGSYPVHLDDPDLAAVATNDLYWDRVTSIDPAGEERVYDLEVPRFNSWIAGAGIVSHNSGQIEADADCVLMLYRDDYYDADSERPGQMDIIVRKNRQGRLGQVTTRIDNRLRYIPVERTP